jgi:hypothetical protein
MTTTKQTILSTEIDMESGTVTHNRCIPYWLLAHQSWNFFRKPVYFCLPYIENGHSSSTTDIKRAMRWFHYGEAEAFAAGLSGTWAPIYVVFDGDELAYIKS